MVKIMTNTIYFDEKVSTHPGYPYHYGYEKASTHPGHSGSLLFATPHPLELMKDAVYERYRIPESLLPILFPYEINIKFNSTFFFFEENIQIICLK
jgi:hypothetical protein